MMLVAHGGKYIDDGDRALQRLVGLRFLLILLRLRLTVAACFSHRAHGWDSRQGKSENARRKAGHAHCIIPLKIIADSFGCTAGATGCLPVLSGGMHTTSFAD